MPNLFINKLDDLPAQYPLKWNAQQTSEDEDSVYYKGKCYQLIGSYEKDYSFSNRLWLIISSLARVIFSVAGFSTASFQENWQIISTGKQIVKVYCNQEELEESDVKAHLLGKEKLNPSSKDKEEKTESVEQKLSPQSKIVSDVTSHPVSKVEVVSIPVSSVDFSALKKIIASSAKGTATKKKKAALFQKGMNLFIKNNISPELETFRLANQDYFKIGNKQSKPTVPVYFNQLFKAEQDLDLEATPLFYDYESTASDVEDVWVDFANAVLGGGCFGHGFVQEEIMVAEMPEFADHIASHVNSAGWCHIAIREGNPKDRNRAMKGSPNPYLLKGLHRIQAVNNNLAYGSKFEGLSQQKLLDSTQPLTVPQKVNILAIAAPKLFTKKPTEQWAPLTLADIFNTLVAGFTLVQEQSENPVIHSGRIGCGVFNNDIHAVYLLHCLAAQHLGVKVKLHGYSPKEAKQFQDSWNKVASQLVDKPLIECMKMISVHLTKNF